MSSGDRKALVGRYLKVVAAHLPATQRDDVVAELRDEIESRLDDRVEALGRDLSEDEIEQVLREVGHPLSVAARYRPGPSHVVGPELYPYWRFAIRAGLLVLLILAGLGLVARVASGDPDVGEVLVDSLTGLFSGAITLVGIATLVAYVIERQSERPRWLHDWKVKDLGLYEFGVSDDWLDNLTRTGGASKAERTAKRRRSETGEALSNVIAWTVVLLWWTGTFRIPGLHPMEWEYVRAGVDWGAMTRETYQWLYFPVIAFGLTRVAFDLGRAAWPGARLYAGVGGAAFALGRVALAAWLWLASPFSAAIAVQTWPEFVERARAAFHPGYDTAGIVMLIVAFIAVEGVFAAVGSLARMGRAAR